MELISFYIVSTEEKQVVVVEEVPSENHKEKVVPSKLILQ
jgi:hypothetical protein